MSREGQEEGFRGESEERVDPLTPIAGIIGGMGRTPVPVAESTCQLSEKPFTPGEILRGESPDKRDTSPTHDQGQREFSGEARDVQREEEPNWELPQPSEPHEPRGGGVTTRDEVPPPTTGEQRKRPPEQKHSSRSQQLIEADTRCRKRLAALARDHIVKLREDRQQMAYDWLEEYAVQASSAKLKGSAL